MFALAAALLACGALLQALPAPPSFTLPDQVVPLKHAVELTIDPDQPAFEGQVRIEVEIRQPTPVVWLNARDLTPDQTAYLSQGRETIPARVWVAGREFIGVETGSRTGRYTVSLHFRGRIDDKAVFGMFRRRVDGNWYVYTTFTPIEARRAFPCFDEPRFKTPWEVSIRVPARDKAFANGPETGETSEADGRKLIHFAVTQPLPAEVVAFGVGPFDVFEGQAAGHGTPIRVITPKGRAAEGKAAAEAAVAVLPGLEAYTGIPYPFGKLDFLAMADAAFGAVENPGLIVYLARELLVNPSDANPPRTHALRLLEAHEIGHQWFGDMVTQANWNDVWLSEGFATWISEKIIGQEDTPERAPLAALAGRERIMTMDASARTRPVRVDVRGRQGSRDIYNRFVYEKGAALMTMLEGWLGEDKVQEGVRAYLSQHRFANATTDDLAAALGRASGLAVDRVIHAFLDTTGIPHVSAEVECKETARLKIQQTGSAALPVCWKTDTGSKSCAVVGPQPSEVALTSCPAWVLLNAGGTGYYRTDWTADQLAALPVERLKPAERLTLVYDLRAEKLAAARPVLAKLAGDAEPEIAAAATRQ